MHDEVPESGKTIVDLAVEMAAKAHEKQVRKGTDIPYITHPFSVALLLCRAGCSDELIAAGMLHDILEDTDVPLDCIRAQFGDRIAGIVEGCSEQDRSLPWEERKSHTLEHLKTAALEVRLVVCADKLHNIRTIASECQSRGDEVWTRFRRGRTWQEWYYKGLVESLFAAGIPDGHSSLFNELKLEVEKVFGANPQAPIKP